MLGILVPVFLSIWFSKRENKSKDRAVTVEVGGEKGLTKRNWRFEHLLETPWEGADTLAILFEQTCARHYDNLLLGTRILISQETEVSEDGRAFEKVTLGHYEWTTYGQAFRSADDFASGLVAIGHEKGERVAIFAETRAEWFLALQVPSQIPQLSVSWFDLTLYHCTRNSCPNFFSHLNLCFCKILISALYWHTQVISVTSGANVEGGLYCMPGLLSAQPYSGNHLCIAGRGGACAFIK